MSMRLVRPQRYAAWLVAGLLGSCALWAMGQDDSAQARLQDQTRHIQDGFYKLGKQLQQLSQNRTQADQTLIRQGQSIQKQIETVERGQAQLGLQLSQLQTESQQQIAQLQHSNRQLSWALWGLAGLAMLMLVLLWRQRATRGQPADLPPVSAAPPMSPAPRLPAAAAVMPEPPPGEPAAAEQSPAVPEPEPTSAASEPAETAPAAVAPTPEPAATVAAGASPSATAAPAWSALVAADLSSTEQALAQARQGFMQPVRIEQ